MTSLIRALSPALFAVLCAFATTAASPPATTTTTTTTPTPTPSAPGAKLDDRDPADKALDAGRKPEQLVAFAGVKPGMKVAELAAGGGYTAEVLARAVGPTGTVYGVNQKWLLDKFAQQPWTDRLKKPVMKNVVRLDRELDDPFPPEVKDLDVVVINLFYHDTVWQKTDRKKMLASVLKALKPGGVFIVIDHAAQAGHGLNDVETFHRIEEKVVVDEVTAAGFKKDGESDAWRNPKDTRDWNDSPRAAGDKRGTSDRFALRFKKP